MPEPIYSRRYPKDGEEERPGDVMEIEDLGKGNRVYLREQRRDLIFGRVVEVTNNNRCDVDIFEGDETLLVKIYLDYPCNIHELNGMLGMASLISINSAKNGHDAVVSIFYDLDGK